MAAYKQELSQYKSKKKRQGLKTFTHTEENITNKKPCRIDLHTIIFIDKNLNCDDFKKKYLSDKALYEAANNTSRFGGRKKGEVKD